MSNPIFRNFDYDTRATMLEKLKRKQKSRQKVAMFERFALTDPIDDVMITPIPYPPAEPAPCGMLDGIYPQEDRESKPISSLDYGILETHMADDGDGVAGSRYERVMRRLQRRDFTRKSAEELVLNYLPEVLRDYPESSDDQLADRILTAANCDSGIHTHRCPHGYVRRRGADDNSAEDEVKPVVVLKRSLIKLREMIRFNIIPYMDPMFGGVIRPYDGIIQAWAAECRMVEDGKRSVVDLAGIEGTINELRPLLAQAIVGGDNLALYKMDEKANTLMEAIIKDLHKLA